MCRESWRQGQMCRSNPGFFFCPFGQTLKIPTPSKGSSVRTNSNSSKNKINTVIWKKSQRDYLAKSHNYIMRNTQSYSCAIWTSRAHARESSDACMCWCFDYLKRQLMLVCGNCQRACANVTYLFRYIFFQKATTFEAGVKQKNHFYHWIPRYELLKTKSHMNMFC